jgi:UDP-3-O-[3-hydroxymyristoyl] glucosamine N-acyltransferase
MAAHTRFFPGRGPLSLTALLAAAEATAEGTSDANAQRRFSGVAALAEAGPDEVSYLEAAKHRDILAASRAGAVVVRAAEAALLPAGCIPIIAALPALAFARIAEAFHPVPRASGQRHPSAAIDAKARIDPSADIGAFAVIGAGAEIGPGCVIHAHAVIGAGVVLGENCTIHPHASISHALCGRGVVLHAGARVGNEGFGFTPTPQGRFVTMPQLGAVVLEDEVEVGANSCIDRGALGDTVVGRGTRIDNLVQLGHNVRTGQGCVIVSQVGISGSAVLGDWVQVAGQAGIAGHLHIGAKARIGAQCGVMRDVEAGADMLGSPARPARIKMREIATVQRLAAAAVKTMTKKDN